MIVRDSDGNSVLTLGDTNVVGGYMVTADYSPAARGWSRIEVSATRVDYERNVAVRRAKDRLTLPVYIEAASETAALALRTALLAAVEVSAWQLDVYGDASTLVWYCDAADLDTELRLDSGKKLVLTFTVPAIPSS